MNNLSIILPYRSSGDQYREKIFQWMLRRYEILFPDSQLIVCDSGDINFSRSKSRNLGATKAECEYLLIADADTMPFHRFVKDGIDKLNSGSTWFFLYGENEYYNADQESSNVILSRSPSEDVHPSEITWEHKITAWAGQILIRTSDFFKVGCYDERFVGWGYEDNAFQVAADCIIGNHERIEDGWTIHIWHPYSHKSTFGQPMIRSNRNLYNQYLQSADNPEKMLELVGLND